MIRSCIHLVLTASSIEMDARVLKMAHSYRLNGCLNNQILAIHYPSNANYCDALSSYYSYYKLFNRRNRGSTLNFSSICAIAALAIHLFKRLVIINKYRSSLAKRLHFHDVHLIFLIPFLRLGSALGIFGKLNIVFDSHELPHDVILRNVVLSLYLSWILSLCDVVVVTSTLRLRYMRRSIARYKIIGKLFPMRRIFSSALIVENYPLPDLAPSVDKNISFDCCLYPGVEHFSSAAQHSICTGQVPITTDLDQSQLMSMTYILWIGSCSEGRMFSFFMRLMSTLHPGISVVVLGGDPSNYILASSPTRDVYVLSVPNSQVSMFIRHSLAIPVFYNNASGPNNRLCSPNKLFDSLRLGTPVFGLSCLSFDYFKKQLLHIGAHDLLDKCLFADSQTLLALFPQFIAAQPYHTLEYTVADEFSPSYPAELLWRPGSLLFDLG
jgi:hypothetical protein